jgi:hypothetical protein
LQLLCHISSQDITSKTALVNWNCSKKAGCVRE